jgi:hypothetical protein
MENLNNQLMHGLLMLLTSKPVSFMFEHSLLLGFISGVISLVPFAVKRIGHAVIISVAMLAIIYLCDMVDLSLHDVFYYSKTILVANLVGNYIFGCIGGFVIANAIQRIRGEHDHVTNN